MPIARRDFAWKRLWARRSSAPSAGIHDGVGHRRQELVEPGERTVSELLFDPPVPRLRYAAS